MAPPGLRLLRHRGWHDGEFIGEAGFQDLRRAVVPSIEGTMEAGWGLVGARQGRGLAEEAMRAALAWAGQHGTGERITCMIHPDNAASLRVAHKLGFVPFAQSSYNESPVVLMQRPRQPR